MKATRILLMFVLMFSVAFAQSEVSNNFKVVSDDHNIFNKGWVYADVTNLNTFYGRDFDVSLFLHNTNAAVLAIEEYKNISHTVRVPNQTTTCNPYDVTNATGTRTEPNCTTTSNPYTYESWYPDWKPAKQFMIDGMKNRQKSTDIHIGRGETKQFRFFVEIPIGSRIKFDVGVYADGVDTILDPWIISDAIRCKNITIVPQLGNDGAHNMMLKANLTGLTFSDPEEIFIVNASCNVVGSEIKRVILDSGSDYTEVYFIVNETMSHGTNITYSVYYDSTGTGTNLTGYEPEGSQGALIHFNDNTGTTATDSSGNSHDYTLNNVAGWDTDTNFGASCLNAGESYYATYVTSDSPDFQMSSDESKTIEMWVYQASDTNDDWMHEQYDGDAGWMIVSLNTKMRSRILATGAGDTGDIFSNSPLIAGAWNHLALVFDRATDLMIMYINGVQDISTDISAIGTVMFDGTSGIGSQGAGTGIYKGRVNEFVIWNYSRHANYNGTPNIAMGAEVTKGELLTITIHSPTANVVYLNNSVLLNFTVTSDMRTTINTTIQLNSTTYLRPDVTNNSAYTVTVNLSRGTQTINIIANDTQESVSFVTIYSNVTSTAYSTPIFEATNQTFNVSISSAYTLSDVQLIWNGTQYAGLVHNATNWYRTIALPIVSVNNTNISVYWNYTVGTPVTYQNTSDTETQTIIFAYVTNTTSEDQSAYAEGESMTIYTYFKNLTNTNATLNVRVTFNGSVYNATYDSYAQNNLIYKVVITAPAVPNDNYTFNFSHNITISANGVKRDLSIANSVRIRYLGFDNCTGYAAPFLKLVTYDEETNAQLSTIDYDVYIVWWQNTSIAVRNYSTSMKNFTNATFCVNPPATNIMVNMTVSYQDHYDKYSTRSWYYINEPLSNVTKTQRLYLLNTSLSYYVSIEVSDGQGTEEPDILVKMQRFFYDESAWREVQVGKTDQAGKTAVYLIRYDEPYSFTLYASQTFIRTYSGRTISESPLALSTAIITDTIWSHLLYVWSVCEFNNVTKLVSCTITDPSSRITGGRLIVDAEGLRGTGRICDNTFSGTSATVTCDISGSNTTSVFWKLSVTRDNVEWPINSGHIIINYPVAIWGATGALFALIIIILLGTIGAWNPAVGITLSVTGLVYCSLAGIFPVNSAALIGVVVVAAILVFRMKT